MKKLIGIFFISIALTAKSQENLNNEVNITTTATPFLRIAPDTRAGGMGEVAMGLSPDANSIFYNNAKTAFNVKTIGASINYLPWQKETADDMFFATAGGYYKPTEQEAITASLRYFSLGNVPLVDYSGTKLMTSQPREFAFDLGYSRKLSDHLGIGLTARYIHSKLANGVVNGIDYKAGSAVAADVSLFYTNKKEDGKGWSGGLALSNLGSKISYTNEDGQSDFIPATIALGAAYTEVWDHDNRITIAADIDKLLVPAVPQGADNMKTYREASVIKSWLKSFDHHAYRVGVGVEYQYKELLMLRLGYSTKTNMAGNWKNISVGAGLQWDKTTINFAYLVPTGSRIDRSPLSNTIRLGVLFGIR